MLRLIVDHPIVSFVIFWLACGYVARGIVLGCSDSSRQSEAPKDREERIIWSMVRQYARQVFYTGPFGLVGVTWRIVRTEGWRALRFRFG